LSSYNISENNVLFSLRPAGICIFGAAYSIPLFELEADFKPATSLIML